MVVTWIIMAVLVVVSILLTRKPAGRKPGKSPALLEFGMSWADNFFTGIIGKENQEVCSVADEYAGIYRHINVIPVLGFKPPNKGSQCDGSPWPS